MRLLATSRHTIRFSVPSPWKPLEAWICNIKQLWLLCYSQTPSSALPTSSSWLIYLTSFPYTHLFHSFTADAKAFPLLLLGRSLTRSLLIESCLHIFVHHTVLHSDLTGLQKSFWYSIAFSSDYHWMAASSFHSYTIVLLSPAPLVILFSLC